MADRDGPVEPGSPAEDLMLQRKDDYSRRFPLIPNKRAQPVWPQCHHREDTVVQVLDCNFNGGRRFFRCPHSGQVTKCNFTRWIDPPHEGYVVLYLGTLWSRIHELQEEIFNLKEQNEDLRQQVLRERGNEEVVNIGSSYDPGCCCSNPSCICACHSHDGQPRPRRPPTEHSTWVPRGTFNW